jgi:hypothetical protein
MKNWVPVTNQRKEIYSKLLEAGNQAQMISKKIRNQGKMI